MTSRGACPFVPEVPQAQPRGSPCRGSLLLRGRAPPHCVNAPRLARRSCGRTRGSLPPSGHCERFCSTERLALCRATWDNLLPVGHTHAHEPPAGDAASWPGRGGRRGRRRPPRVPFASRGLCQHRRDKNTPQSFKLSSCLPRDKRTTLGRPGRRFPAYYYPRPR